MGIELIFLDKHRETLPLMEAERRCIQSGGVIMDAITEDEAAQKRLRAIIDLDRWLIKRQKRGLENEQVQHVCAAAR